MNTSFGFRCLVYPQLAWARRREALGSAVASEVALGKNLNEVVLAMALHGAGITNASSIVGVRGIQRRRIASEASKNGLSQRAKGLCATFDALLREVYGQLRCRDGGTARGVSVAAYIGKCFAGISLELFLFSEKADPIKLAHEYQNLFLSINILGGSLRIVGSVGEALGARLSRRDRRILALTYTVTGPGRWWRIHG